MYIYIYVHVYTYACVYLCLYLSACIHTYIRIHISSPHTVSPLQDPEHNLCVHTHVYIYTYIYPHHTLYLRLIVRCKMLQLIQERVLQGLHAHRHVCCAPIILQLHYHPLSGLHARYVNVCVCALCVCLRQLCGLKAYCACVFVCVMCAPMCL